MLDLNHILLFIALLSPLVVLVRTARRPAQNRSWQLAAMAVLIVTGAAYFANAETAGFVGGGAWLFLLFLPAAGSRKAAALVMWERYSAAARLIGLLRWLHPSQALRGEYAVLRGLEIAQAGDRAQALQILRAASHSETLAGPHAVAEAFRLRHDWEGLLAWSRENIPRVGLGEDPSRLLFYFRALGELGLRDELVLQFAGRAPHLLASPVHQPLFVSALLILLAFAGRPAAVERLLRTRLSRLTRDRKEFWRATSEMAAGNPAARGRLESLRVSTQDALLRSEIEERLRRSHFESLPPLSLPNESTVRRFEREVGRRESSLLIPQSSASPAVFVIIGLNLAMFLLEIVYGGSQNPIALHRLGALEPWAIFVVGQYWRLLSALFLHYGVLHLAVNAYALYVLGPSLEASIGSTRFVISYLASGIGSSAGVVLLWRFGLTQADLLVGASGAVMGIVGTWAGLLLGHRHMPMARRRLINIAIIVGIQTAFDFSTPQVSMGAHLCGFASGVLVGLLLAPREKS